MVIKRRPARKIVETAVCADRGWLFRCARKRREGKGRLATASIETVTALGAEQLGAAELGDGPD